MDAVIDPDALPAVVARAADGDEIAFARLVAAHHDDMARVAYVICGDPDLAQEAVQRSWPKVWRKVGSLRDHGSFPSPPTRHASWLAPAGGARSARSRSMTTSDRWSPGAAIPATGRPRW